MTFQRIEFKRVMVAVATIWGLSIILTFLSSCITTPFMPAAMGDRAAEYLEAFSDPDTTMEESNDLFDDYLQEFSSELTVQYIIQWTLVALVIYVISSRVARNAQSPEQAVGYGVLISSGMLFTYGVMCACIPALALGSGNVMLIMVVFLGLFMGAGYAGGRNAGMNLKPSTPETMPSGAPDTSSGRPGFGTSPAPGAGTTNPQVSYNMGVQAALSGRREEARQHFTRVLQMQPRNVAAWLQLANLADTPDQAWNYVQQARSIKPTDPAVLEAVNIIWPQVAANAEQRDVPHNQPPYPGGQQDDNAIPRSRLPGSVLDAAEDVSPTDTQDGDASREPDDSGDSGEPEPPPDAPPPPPDSDRA